MGGEALVGFIDQSAAHRVGERCEEAVTEGGAGCRDLQQCLATVGWVGDPFEKASLLQPVDQIGKLLNQQAV